jgi:hypothetical protein
MQLKPENRKLRFAVMLQNDVLKRWQADVIQTLIQHQVAEPVLLIFNNGFSEIRLIQKTSKPNILWRFYERFYLRKGPLQNISLPYSLMNTSTISCKTEKKGKFSEYFAKEDIEKIRSYQPDFILRFGFSIIRGEILNSAPYGVWSFHHSDEQLIRGGPAGFRELSMKHPKQGVILQRLTEHLDGGIILKKRFYKTILHNNAHNLFHILESSTDLPLQVCKDILNGEAEYFNSTPAASKAPVYSFPNLFQMSFFPFRQFFRRIRYNLQELFTHEKWSIGIVKYNFSELISKGKLPENGQIFSYSSAGSYPADPFIIDTGKKLRLFFEHFSYKNGKGGISSILYDNDFGFHDEIQIISNRTHRSFPFTFQHHGKTYIIPEQIETGRTDLYEWDETVKQLIFVCTLLNKPLADPVLLNCHDKWWLFGSGPGADVNNSLNLYNADLLTGTFTPHPQNSIVVNPCGARMAGSIITYQGKLYRLGQDSQHYYGKRICVFEIQHLSDTKYTEKFVTYIEPFQHQLFRKGIHTLNISGPYIIFDGKKMVFSKDAFQLRLMQKLKRRYHV